MASAGTTRTVPVRRMALLITLAPALVWSMMPSSAAAAAPSPPAAGGRYLLIHSRSAAGNVQLSLVVAGDRQEFATNSWVSATLDCGQYVTDWWIKLDDTGGRPWRAAPVSPMGTFARSDSQGSVQGHFTAHGRRVEGVVTVAAAGPCRALRARFRARLVDRPNALPPAGRAQRCDPVHRSAEVTYLVVTRDLGCTDGRRVVRSYVYAPQCRGLSSKRTCATRQALCRNVRGGVVEPLAAVSCRPLRRRAAVVETVLRRPCGHTAISFPDSTFRFGRDLWVFNMPCPVAEAFPILDLVEGAQPACQVPSSDTERLCPPFNGYRCTNLVQIVGNTLLHEGRCTLVEDHFLAFDYLTDDHGF